MKNVYLIASFVLATSIANAQMPELSFEFFASGFSSPTSITNTGIIDDGRLFIVEQNGLIKFIKSGNTSIFIDLSEVVGSPDDNLGGYDNELGLLGLAFHPDHQNNGYFYVNYTNTNTNTVIARYSVSSSNSDQGDASSELILLEIDQPFQNHNGGCINFGPDNHLYIGMGDGGSGGDPDGYGQNMTSLLGKLLRIDVDADSPYIPNDNPFVGNNDYAPEIWASGLRNPWKFSFDKLTGDLWIGDVGQNAFEEIDFQSTNSNGGENYGWNCYEGFAAFDNSGCNDTYTDPIHIYVNDGFGGTSGCSVTGGYVYRGSTYPNLYGHYIYGDYCSGKTYTIYDDEGGMGWQNTTQEDTEISMSAFGEDLNNELYIADQATGIIYSVVDTSVLSESYDEPESVDYDPISNRYFISNTGTGEILVRENSGFVSVFADVGSGPHGLEVIGNEIYACSGSRLKAYDLTTGEETVDVNLNAVFANGITHKGNDVFVTDFSGSKILRYNIESENFNTYIDNFPSTPNGIYYDDINDRMLVVSWGSNAPIYEINLTDSSYSVAANTPLGNCDGIAMDNDGDFYVSAWSNNSINKFSSDFSGEFEVAVSNMSSPADIFYNRDSDTLAIPNSGNSTVVFVGYGTVSNDLNNNFKTNKLNFYPNPIKANEKMTFNEFVKNIELFDLRGKLIQKLEMDGSKSILIPNVNGGIYILKTENKYSKIIIE